nr:hypothetical protein [Catenibacterium mitsuokai]
MAQAKITADSTANIRDYLLELDDIGKPKVVDMTDIRRGKLNSAATMIIRLLLLKKGTYPDFPNLGIDIRGRYRFMFSEELSTLESELTDQIETYLPELLPITVSAEMITIPSTTANGILFNIISNEIDFVLLYNINKNTFDGIRAS